jgi:hypothetical protein
MRFIGHDFHLLAVKSHADQPRIDADFFQSRDCPVIVACTIADTMTTLIESGKRDQQPVPTIGAPRTSSRKIIVCLSMMTGRHSRAPFSRIWKSRGRKSTSERIGQKPETLVPESTATEATPTSAIRIDASILYSVVSASRRLKASSLKFFFRSLMVERCFKRVTS